MKTNVHKKKERFPLLSLYNTPVSISDLQALKYDVEENNGNYIIERAMNAVFSSLSGS